MKLLIRKLLSSLFLPLPLLYVLIGSSILLFILKKKKPAKILAISAVAWLILITTPFLSVKMVKSLEYKYNTLIEIPDSITAGNINIMVLGSGHTENNELSPNDQLSSTALSRLTEGIRLHRLMPGSTMIFSGFAGRDSLSQAEALFNAAIALGVDSSRTIQLRNPSNTYAEATEFSRLGKEDEILIVVTDAVHMPRAMKLFKQAGLDPIPAPTNFILKEKAAERHFSFIPSEANITNMNKVMHEYMGMIWAKMRYK